MGLIFLKSFVIFFESFLFFLSTPYFFEYVSLTPHPGNTNLPNNPRNTKQRTVNLDPRPWPIEKRALTHAYFHRQTIEKGALTMHFQAFPRISMHFQTFSCISRHFQAFPGISMHFHAFPCISLHFHAFPCISMHFQAFPNNPCCMDQAFPNFSLGASLTRGPCPLFFLSLSYFF